jgi:hypothetical protein
MPGGEHAPLFPLQIHDPDRLVGNLEIHPELTALENEDRRSAGGKVNEFHVLVKWRVLA